MVVTIEKARGSCFIGFQLIMTEESNGLLLLKGKYSHLLSIADYVVLISSKVGELLLLNRLLLFR